MFGKTIVGGAYGDGTVFALTLPAPKPGTLALVGALCLAGGAWRYGWRRLAGAARTSQVRRLIVYSGVAILLAARTTRADTLFLANYDAGTIYKFSTSSGSKSVFASGVVGPGPLSFDKNGNLFVASPATGDVYKFAPSGGSSTFASGLSFPTAIAFSPSGDLFVANYNSDTIDEFTSSGGSSVFVTGLDGPEGLTFDTAGNLYESDVLDGTINKFASNGAKSTFASGLSQPEGLAFDTTGNLFVAGHEASTIYNYSGGVRSNFATVDFVTSLAFDSSGDLFAFNDSSEQIDEFPSRGGESVFASGFLPAGYLAVAPVPEPGTVPILCALCLVGFAWRRGWRRPAGVPDL